MTRRRRSLWRRIVRRYPDAKTILLIASIFIAIAVFVFYRIMFVVPWG